MERSVWSGRAERERALWSRSVKSRACGGEPGATGTLRPPTPPAPRVLGESWLLVCRQTFG